jgi:hypothetical protein
MEDALVAGDGVPQMQSTCAREIRVFPASVSRAFLASMPALTSVAASCTSVGLSRGLKGRQSSPSSSVTITLSWEYSLRAAS